MKAAGTPVEERDPGRRALLLQELDGPDTHTLVAHQEVAHTEDEDGRRGLHYFVFSMNFHPPTIDDVTPRPST